MYQVFNRKSNNSVILCLPDSFFKFFYWQPTTHVFLLYITLSISYGDPMICQNYYGNLLEKIVRRSPHVELHKYSFLYRLLN